MRSYLSISLTFYAFLALFSHISSNCKGPAFLSLLIYSSHFFLVTNELCRILELVVLEFSLMPTCSKKKLKRFSVMEMIVFFLGS